MRWSLKANEKVGKGTQTKREWVEQLEADGHDTVGMLDEEPELYQDLYVYWHAFHVLTSSRNSGMSIGAIPLPAYESYFRIFGVDSLEEQLMYLKFVGALDSELLSWQGEESAKKKNKNKSKPKGKGRKAK
jgi:hypothetical protein